MTPERTGFCMVLLIAAPLLAGVLANLVRFRSPRRLIGLVSILLLAGVAALARALAAGGPLRYAIGGWTAPLGIQLYLDGLSLTLLAASVLAGPAIALFAAAYFDAAGGAREPKFWPLWFFLWAGLHALFLSADIFNLYVALEVIGFCAVAMVALARTRAAIEAAIRYALLAMMGSLCYLLGVGLIYGQTGSLDALSLGARLTPGLPATLAIAFILIGVAIKAALFPLHGWLPPAHGSAPTPVSAALSGLVVTAAFYLLVRLWFGVFAGLVSVAGSHLIGAMGVLAILWGGVLALRAQRLKMIVAWSTVSQLGYVFLLFPLAGAGDDAARLAWNGGIYYAVSHSLAKAAAFLAAGALLRVYGSDRLDDLRGAAVRCPFLTFAFILAGVSLMGLPPTSGFVAKWMLLKASLASGWWAYSAAILVGSLLAAGYLFRPVERMLLHADAESPVRPPTGALRWAPLTLALMTIVLGLTSSLFLGLLDIMHTFPFLPNEAGL
jgi:multicomponent Na+:H+ antiporter subunit D